MRLLQPRHFHAARHPNLDTLKIELRLAMPHENEGYNPAPVAWGSNGSGGDITVDSLYELREALQRVGSVVDLSPEYDGKVRHGNSNGTISLFTSLKNGSWEDPYAYPVNLAKTV